MDIENKIKTKIENELGDEIMDLMVSDGYPDFPYSEAKAIKVVGRVRAFKIVIEKYASRFDLFKASMPKFIRRIMPPKTVEIEKTIGLSAIQDCITKQKVASLIYYTNEYLSDAPDDFIMHSAAGASESLRNHYKSNKISCL